jgi:PAS domain S-box-containing protein
VPDRDALSPPPTSTSTFNGASSSSALAGADVARALFEHSPFSTVLYDTAGCVVAVNAAFERLFGLTKDAIPADYSVLTDPQLDQGGHLAVVRRAFDGENVVLPLVFYDATTIVGGGRRNWTQGHFFPMRDLAGRVTGVVLIHVDLTERVEAEEARRLSDERLRIALDVGRLGAWEWDIAGNRVHWSDTLQRIHGLVPGTFGGTFDEYQSDIHPDDRERVLGQIAHSLEGAAHRLEYRIVRPDGEMRWLEARGELFRAADGSPLRMLGICTDVTERKLAEEERAAAHRRLEAQAAELEEANRAKGDFLATMSHELRTPLNAIGGYAQLIEMGVHGPITDEQREALRRVQKSQQHLLSLINDVLNFAKLEAGHVTYDVGCVSVRELLAGLDPLVAPQLAAKSLRFACAPCEATLAVAADAEKTQQILLNLLSNAIKFTPDGGQIHIEARAHTDTIHVDVSDTGIGIPADRIEAVFEPFVQLARGASSGREGTGLGLAISRDLARAMGGDITVDSVPDRGSTFTLALPRFAEDIAGTST